ncbi:MAG: hypothetical protein WDN06_16065 [Asticcacaulis sp.]
MASTTTAIANQPITHDDLPLVLLSDDYPDLCTDICGRFYQRDQALVAVYQ